MDTGVSDYHRIGYDWRRYYQPRYRAGGDYLNYGSTFSFELLKPGPTTGPMMLGDDGVPMYKPEGATAYFYDPVTVASFALSLHSLYAQGARLDPRFWAALKRMLLLQSPDGGFHYPIASGFEKPGWTSSMAQGQGLSVYARAFALDHDPRWLAAGDAALAFMMRDVAAGGDADDLGALDRSLSSYLVLEEYPETVPSYTLNGFGFTLLGLYDWWQLDRDQHDGPHAMAGAYFRCGVHTFGAMADYYDLGGITAYDMNHVIKGLVPRVWVHYHEIHLGLLRALSSIAPTEATLSTTMTKWAGFVSQPEPEAVKPVEAPRRTPVVGGCRPPASRSAPHVVRIGGSCVGVPTDVVAATPADDGCPHWSRLADDGCSEELAMTCYAPVTAPGVYSTATGTLQWAVDGSCGQGTIELVLRDHTGAFVCVDYYSIDVSPAGKASSACFR